MYLQKYIACDINTPSMAELNTLNCWIRFAAAIGEHEAVVSRVVREKIQLDPERKQKWASALGADVEKLFGKETTNGEA